MKKLFTAKTRGFGLLEVLLAGVIIIIMLAGLVTLGKTVLNNLNLSAERAAATFLAQQGIELTRQIRDTNYVDGNNTTQWNSLVYNGLSWEQPTSGAKYAINWLNNRVILRPQADASGDVLVGGIKFNREISFQKITMGVKDEDNNIVNADVYKVTCLVTWRDIKTVQIDEIIADSHPNF